MFRFETIVGLVIAMSSGNLWSATIDLGKVAGGIPESKKEEAYEKWEKNCQDDSKRPAYCAKFEAAFNMISSSDECSDRAALKEKVNNARKEFRLSCGPAGFSINNSSTDIECSAAIERCNNCTSTKANEMSGNRCDATVANDTNEEGFNFGKMARVAKYCPAMGAKNAKDFEKRLDEAKKDKKATEDKLPQAMKKMTEARNKGEDDAAKAQETMTKARQQLDQQLSESRKKYNQEKKRIAEEIVQLQQQIAQVDDGIRQMVLQKADAEVQFDEAIRQIENNCYNSASRSVEELQRRRLSQPFNRGNFLAMAKQIGLTDRESWKRVADRYYRYCLASQLTRTSKKSAKATYDSALRKADAGLAKFNEQRLALIKQQMDKRNGVCNPSQDFSPDFTGSAPQESDSCTAAKEALADAQQAQRTYNSEANKAAAEVAKAERKAANEEGAARMEAAQLQRQMQEDDNRVRNLRRAYQIANEAADDTPSGDPNSHQKALEKYSDFNSAASKYVECLKNDCNGDSLCKTLKAYRDKNDTGSAIANLEESGVEPAAVESKMKRMPSADYYRTPSGPELTDMIKKEAVR